MTVSDLLCGELTCSCLYCCAISLVDISGSLLGGGESLVTFAGKAVNFQRLNLVVPIRLQSKTMWTRDYFVSVDLCCYANARIVDSKMNVQHRIPRKGWQKAVDRCARGPLVWLAVHSHSEKGIAGSASSLFVAAYGINGSQGELSKFACKVSLTSKLGVPWKQRAIIWVVCDTLVSRDAYYLRLSHEWWHVMEVDSFSRECYQAWAKHKADWNTKKN